MTPTIALGLRLARGIGVDGRVRAGLVVVATGVASLVLLATVALVQVGVVASGGGLRPEDQVLYSAIAATVGVPILLLLASVTRLSASVRDRRLAALRLLGLSPGQTRTVAATEAAVLAVGGLLLGAGAFYAVWPFAGGLLAVGYQSTAAGIYPTSSQVLLVVIGVLALVVAVSLAPSRAVTARPLAIRRGATPKRPSLLRVVPVVAGAALLSWMFMKPQEQFASPEDLSGFQVFVVGAILSGVGLVLVVPLLVRTFADLLARLTRRPAVLVASRRLRQEPASTTRLVAGLLLAVFVVTGARSLLASWESTPAYIEVAQATAAGTQVITVTGIKPADAAASLRSLTATPEVHKVVPADVYQDMCAGDYCFNVYVGTCAELRRLQPVTGCRDDRIAWVNPAGTDAAGAARVDLPPPGTPLVLQPEGGSARVEIEAPSAHVMSPSGGGSASFYLDSTVFLPRSVPGAAALVPLAERSYVIFADAGEENADRVIDAVPSVDSTNISLTAPDYMAFKQVRNYRHMLWGVTGVVVLTGLVAFGIAAIDRAMERRREVASLHVLGAPAGLVRGSQLLQALIPLGIGLPLAGALGFLAGSDYLAFAQLREYAPWQSILTLMLISVAAAALVAASSVVALNPGANPAMLRRE